MFTAGPVCKVSDFVHYEFTDPTSGMTLHPGYFTMDKLGQAKSDLTSAQEDLTSLDLTSASGNYGLLSIHVQMYDKLGPKCHVKRLQNDQMNKTLVSSDAAVPAAAAASAVVPPGHHPVPGLSLLGAALHLLDHGHDGRRLRARGHRGRRGQQQGHERHETENSHET